MKKVGFEVSKVWLCQGTVLTDFVNGNRGSYHEFFHEDDDQHQDFSAYEILQRLDSAIYIYMYKYTYMYICIILMCIYPYTYIEVYIHSCFFPSFQMIGNPSHDKSMDGPRPPRMVDVSSDPSNY